MERVDRNRSVKWNGLSSSTLKIIAMVTMVIDHIGFAIYAVLPNFNMDIYKVMRGIGRISFPIYCFLLVEGFLRTGNVKKYMQRLFLFALISEVPFDVAFHDVCIYANKQNIFFTLLLGLAAIQGISKCMGFQTIKYIKQLGIILITTGIAEVIHVDYGAEGVFFIILLYYGQYYGKKYMEILGTLGGLCLFQELPIVLAFIPIHFYNGKRGLRLKYLFYFFYPVHLIIIGFIRFLIIRN